MPETSVDHLDPRGDTRRPYGMAAIDRPKLVIGRPIMRSQKSDCSAPLGRRQLCAHLGRYAEVGRFSKADMMQARFFRPRCANSPRQVSRRSEGAIIRRQ